MKMIIATGGTGGHIYPALALAQKAIENDNNTQILFIGNDNRMEANLIPSLGYRFIGLRASGLSGGILSKGKAVLQMLKAQQKAKQIIEKEQPDIVVGFGGYVSAPVLRAAQQLGVKTMLHEQNSVMGKSNQILVKKSNAIVVCYEKCLETLPKHKTRLLGNPRSTQAVEIKYDETYFTQLQVRDDRPIVLVVMGSLGSTSINELMTDALQDLKNVSIIYVTGKNNYETMKNKFNQENIYVFDYIDQLAILKKVDLIICRAGATTAAEISALGVPSILIPSPYVAHNHQYYNASVLVEQKSALMIEEKDLNKEVLCDKINTVIHNQELIEEMKQNALKHAFPKASQNILKFIEEVVKNNGSIRK